MLQLEFLAGVQLLVYIGGIVVLLVFAVMLTSSMELLEDQPSRARRFVGFVASVAFFVLTATALWSTDFAFLAAPQRTASDVHEIGRRLLDPGPNGYVLPFEVISVLLLASVVGGIVVARKVRDSEPDSSLAAGAGAAAGPVGPQVHGPQAPGPQAPAPPDTREAEHV
jgi:NADH-quinone oxidoreductase subunit J